MIFQITPIGYGYGWFTQAFAFLQQLGILDSIIPFILIFAILYGILKQVAIFKDNRINIVIAISIALIPVIQHAIAPTSNDVVSIINRFLPGIVLLGVAILIVMLMTGFVRAEGGIWGTLKEFGPWVALVLIILIFLSSITIPYFPYANFIYLLFDPTLIALVVAILIAGLVIFFITRPEEKKS